MAQKSKSGKDGNVDFFNRKKWGKISNISNTNTTVVFGENRLQIQVCIPPEEEAIASKASVIHVCRSICLFVCPKQQKTKQIDKYKMKLRIVVFQDISHNFLPHPPIPPEKEAIASKASVIHVCMQIHLFVCLSKATEDETNFTRG